MKIAIDLMGGDHAPHAIIEGAIALAKAYPQHQLVLVGLPAVLEALAPPANVSTVACGSMMAMDEDVSNLMTKRDSSIWVATELVKKGEADAIISAGSTGAQMTAATLLLSRIKGCERPPIAVLIPTPEGNKVLLDVGANAECTAAMLLSFARMGVVYAEQLLGYNKPRVGLLANGTEEHKGNKLTQEAYALIKDSGLNFIGNCEGRDILKSGYEVLVCDGMSGNIALKSIEGALSTVLGLIKKEFTSSFSAKIGAALVKDKLSAIKKMFDQEEHGGAPLLGVKGISIVCHGGSRGRAIFRAGEVAIQCHEHDFVAKLTAALDLE